MDQKKRLALCSGCTRRQLDFEHGYVCQLTGKFADFKDECKHYEKDLTVTDTIKVRTEDRPFVPLFEPAPKPVDQRARKKPAKRRPVKKQAVKRKPVKKQAVHGTAVKREKLREKALEKKQPSKVALKKLRRYQSFLYALIGGLLVTAISAMGWAYINAVMGYREVYMALGVGLLVGLSVRFFGAGIHWIFGILAALLALAGSLLGYYLSMTGFLEGAELAGIFKVTDYLIPDIMFEIMRDAFVPLDLVFYGLAALLAYFLAIRRIGQMKMIILEREDIKGAPALYWLRLPLILAGILLPAYYGYTLTSQDSTESKDYITRYYDSGAKMSEGALYNNLETGDWTSWHENGQIKSTGYYTEGQKDSLWQWYDESGILSGTGMFKDGVENGTWMHYYPDGIVSDSGTYLDGLKEGLWEYYHENGGLKNAINYKADKMHGEKILVSAAGVVVKVDHYENGELIEQD